MQQALAPNPKSRPRTEAAEPLVSTEQVAAFLGKPVSWLYNNAERLGVPRYPIGNHYRFRISEVAEWVEHQAVR